MKTVLNISLLGCLFASVTSYAAQKPYTLHIPPILLLP